ncbi:MAG: hypothetical protein IJ948_01295, partial [Clostridia bacterium]|nr:hypothetical protein [Clostridia bacterium]
MAKIFGNFSGAVAVLPAILLIISWWKILKTDGQYLLCNYVRTVNSALLNLSFKLSKSPMI